MSEIPLYEILSKFITEPKQRVESKESLWAESMPSISLVGSDST